MTSYVWCNLYEDVSPNEYNRNNITIDPTSGETIIGEKVVDGLRIAVYTDGAGVNTGYFKVYGSRVGCGLEAVGEDTYGLGYGWADNELTEISYENPSHFTS